MVWGQVYRGCCPKSKGVRSTLLTSGFAKDIIAHYGKTIADRIPRCLLPHHIKERTLKEIGEYFNIGESAVSQTSHRFGLALNRDKGLRKKMEHIREWKG